MTEDLTERQKQVKEFFIKERKHWNEELYGSLLRLDPDFLEAWINFFTAPIKKKEALSQKVREFIYIAIDAATTHLYEPGTRRHIRNALSLGATKEELVEVLEIVTGLGIHSVTMGMPILEEELKKSEADAKK